MKYRKEGVPMGLPVMSEFSVYRTDQEVVAEAKALLQQWESSQAGRKLHPEEG